LGFGKRVCTQHEKRQRKKRKIGRFPTTPTRSHNLVQKHKKV